MTRNTAIVSLLLLLPVGGQALGAISSAERGQLTRINNSINAAARLYKRDEFRDCGIELRKAQRLIEQLAAHADTELLKALQPSHRRLQRAHQLVGEKGVPLAAIKRLPTPAETQAAREKAKAAAKERAAKKKAASVETADDAEDAEAEKTTAAETVAGEKPEAAESSDVAADIDASTGDISFTKQVAPILVRRCGRCHVRDSKGDFEMPTYAALMKGPEGGPVVVAEKPDDSSLIQLVEDGEMPPRGGPVPAKEIRLLKDWVAQGAKFDGESKTASLMSLLPSGARTDAG